MKRSELTVGAELYYAPSYEWKNEQLGDKVVVKATEPYRRDPSSWGLRSNRISQVGSGPGVLVDRYRRFGIDCDKPTRTVVPLGHLRGPYEETKAEVEKRAAEAAARRAEDRERRDQRADEVREILRRAEATGFEVWHGVSGGGTHTVTMTPETLASMLAAIEDRTERVV